MNDKQNEMNRRINFVSTESNITTAIICLPSAFITRHFTITVLFSFSLQNIRIGENFYNLFYLKV